MTTVPTTDFSPERSRPANPIPMNQLTRPVPGDMWVHRPDHHTVVVGVCGELDRPHIPRFAELLNARLKAVVQTVIIDLSRVSFLCVDALELLINADRRAQARGIDLRLITGPAAVDRALRAGDVRMYTERYTSHDDAMAATRTTSA